MRILNASHASTIDPIDCIRSVNLGQDESSTRIRDFRNTKCNVFGLSTMLNLDCIRQFRRMEVSSRKSRSIYNNAPLLLL